MAQSLGQGGGADVPIWRVIGALIVCLALGVGGAFALRNRMRLGGAPRLFGVATRRLQLVESLRLSHQVDVCVLVCDDQQYLIAASPQGTVVLATLGPVPQAQPAEAS